MLEWEYTKIDLNDLPRNSKDVDVLNDAGTAGWELVLITSNNIAYLKRKVAKSKSKRSARSTAK